MVSKQAMIFRCRNGMCSNEIDPNIDLFCEGCRILDRKEGDLIFQLPEGSLAQKLCQKYWDLTMNSKMNDKDKDNNNTT